METLALSERHVQNLLAKAPARWVETLRVVGIEEIIFGGQLGDCPNCGTTGAFIGSDRFGNKACLCNACGGYGAFVLMQRVLGASADELLREVVAVFNSTSPPTKHRNARYSELIAKLWEEAAPVVKGDPVDTYLGRRGLSLEQYPSTLRCHPSLAYYDRAEGRSRRVPRGHYAALLAQVQSAFPDAGGLYRLYLKDGERAPVATPEKFLGGPCEGGSIRLGEAGSVLSVGLGLENCLAVFKRTGCPIWACIHHAGFEKLWLPDAVRQLKVYGINDADRDFARQAAAYLLARSFMRVRPNGQPRSVEVYIPKAVGAEWAEVYRFSRPGLRPAA